MHNWHLNTEATNNFPFDTRKGLLCLLAFGEPVMRTGMISAGGVRSFSDVVLGVGVGQVDPTMGPYGVQLAKRVLAVNKKIDEIQLYRTVLVLGFDQYLTNVGMFKKGEDPGDVTFDVSFEKEHIDGTSTLTIKMSPDRKDFVDLK